MFDSQTSPAPHSSPAPVCTPAPGHDAAPNPRKQRTGSLVRALIALAGGHGAVVEHAMRNWASITFSGTRHHITLAFAGDEAIAGGDTLIALAPDHEFDLPGEIVADLAICEVRHHAGGWGAGGLGARENGAEEATTVEPVLRVMLEVLTVAEG